MLLSSEIKKMFPLRNIRDILELFKKQVQSADPSLTVLSCVSGYLENTLTSRFGGNNAGEASDAHFPVITFETIETLHKKFQNMLSVIDPPTKTKHHRYATREIIKRISDLIWNTLIRSTYKDRAHLQSLYSYLAYSKLDCFGVAFAVVSACQMLNYSDVHLAVSEDHAWVVFGRDQETVEVTWHGKGFEDKRGQSVSTGVESQSWLYLCGHPVVCDRHMEVVALILAINPSLNVSSACLEVTTLQQELLWLMYDNGHLQKYPMGLGNLGELEELTVTEGRPTCEDLYAEAVETARRMYKNYHVYPYTYQAGYYYRTHRYKDAFCAYANSGDVIRMYVYSRDDEEIYKELLDIANEQIPSIMKTESSGHSAASILRDPNCFAHLLRFYDGICQWEEGSLTPILHIGWAKPLVSTIAKFDYDIRSQVVIQTAGDDEDLPQYESATIKADSNETNNNNILKTNNNNMNAANESKLPPTLAALTAACGEKILNPDFLLQGDGQPFTTSDSFQDKEVKVEVVVEKKVEPSVEEAKVENNIPEPVATKIEESEVPERSWPVVKLYSQKMKGLKDLLLAEKLNTQAISLQVTAQSQVGKKTRNVVSCFGFGADVAVLMDLPGISATDKALAINNNQNTAVGNTSDLELGSRPKRRRE